MGELSDTPISSSLLHFWARGGGPFRLRANEFGRASARPRRSLGGGGQARPTGVVFPYNTCAARLSGCDGGIAAVAAPRSCLMSSDADRPDSEGHSQSAPIDRRSFNAAVGAGAVGTPLHQLLGAPASAAQAARQGASELCEMTAVDLVGRLRKGCLQRSNVGVWRRSTREFESTRS
jgi:hypothetical protein